MNPPRVLRDQLDYVFEDRWTTLKDPLLGGMLAFPFLAQELAQDPDYTYRDAVHISRILVVSQLEG